MTEDKEIIKGNITRYCKPSTIKNNRLKPSAFELRSNENYLSAYLLEYFGHGKEKENVKAAKRFMEEVNNFSFRNNSGFAVLDIEHTKQQMMENASQEIRFKEEKLPHCGIFSNGDDLVIAKLLTQCVHALYLAKDLENEG